MGSHRGSSLIFLGFSVIAFVLTYGLLFMLVPTVLGVFFSAANQMQIADAGWAATRASTQATLQWLIPLVPAIGMFILVIKVMMVASVRGRD